MTAPRIRSGSTRLSAALSAEVTVTNSADCHGSSTTCQQNIKVTPPLSRGTEHYSPSPVKFVNDYRVVTRRMSSADKTADKGTSLAEYFGWPAIAKALGVSVVTARA